MPTCTLYPLPYQPDPAAYFARLRQAPGAILLDSARPGAERGRFDLLSAWPLQQLQAHPDEQGSTFLQRLRAGLANLGHAQLPEGSELPFAGGLIGYLSYDFGRRLEHLPSLAVDDLGLPDAQLGLYAWALVSDHLHGTSQLVFHPSLADSERERLITLFEGDCSTASGNFQLLAPMAGDLQPEQYRAAFDQVQRYIQAGDCYQINLTQRFRAPCQGDPWRAYQALRQACPTPFSGTSNWPMAVPCSVSPRSASSASARGRWKPGLSRALARAPATRLRTSAMPRSYCTAPRTARKT